jgi:hypothetical protein
MRTLSRWILGALLALASLAIPASGHAQSTAAATEAPLLLSVEGAGARLSVTRLRRALTAALGRPILRMTDTGACDATGTLHIAFSGPRNWILRLDSGATHAVRTIEVRGPALETLVGVAVDLVHRAGAASDPVVASAGSTASTTTAPADPTTRRRSVVAEPWGDPRLAAASEILDPFEGMPIARVVVFASSELLDPFSAVGASVNAASHPEVLDPWR